METRMDLLWTGLETPTPEQGLAAIKVEGTNCWITKDADNSLGFVMVGVHQPTMVPRLSNIDFRFSSVKELDQSGVITELNRCLEVGLTVRRLLLYDCIRRMTKLNPLNTHLTPWLVYEQVIELVHDLLLFRLRKLWGQELFVLKLLLESASNEREWSGILSGWEAQGEARDIIDFRFHHLRGGTAIEVKTSTSGRIHHIRGMNQVTVPAGFHQGMLASVCIRFADGGAGKTCAQLIEEIESLIAINSPRAPELLALFGGRVNRRGNSCNDGRFEFLLADDVWWIAMEDVPKPRLSPSITQVEWVADVSDIPFNQSLTELIAVGE